MQCTQAAEESLLPLRIGLRIDVPLDIPHYPLRPRVRDEAFLIVSEALNNVVKHAQASTVWLCVRCRGRRVMVEVTDDGTGFDASSGTLRSGGGLGSMHARAEAVSAELDVDSTPGQGTCVRLILPLR